MQTGEETEINLDTFVSGFYSISLNEQLADLEINGEEFDFNSLFNIKKENEPPEINIDENTVNSLI